MLAARAENDKLLDLVYQLRADPRVSSGSLSSKTSQADINHGTLLAAATTGMPALITDAPVAFAVKGMLPSMTLKPPDDEPGSIEPSGHMGPWAETAFDAYEALRAEISLTSFHADEAATTVTLAH